MTFTYRSVDALNPDFAQELTRLSRRGETDLERVEPAVKDILAAVRSQGDAAVLGFVEKFERRKPAQLFVRDYGGAQALEALPAPVRQALELSATRVRRYHEEQKKHLAGFAYTEGGITLESRVRAVSRAGVYAPGRRHGNFGRGRSAGHRRVGVRDRERAEGRQDRRAGQPVRDCGQTPGLRRGRHRQLGGAE